MDKDENLKEPEENIKSIRSKRKIEEEDVPVWVKMFGGSIISVIFLCVITLAGYIVNSVNAVQTQINCINVDMMAKKEFLDREANILSILKKETDNAVSFKERLIFIDNQLKEIQSFVEKIETKISEQNKNAETASKEIQSDVQYLRERLASLEAKSGFSIMPNKK